MSSKNGTSPTDLNEFRSPTTIKRLEKMAKDLPRMERELRHAGVPYESYNKPKKEIMDVNEFINKASGIAALYEKAEAIIHEAELTGEDDARAKLVSDILWQVNYHRKNLDEYTLKLEYLVK